MSDKIMVPLDDVIEEIEFQIIKKERSHFDEGFNHALKLFYRWLKLQHTATPWKYENVEDLCKKLFIDNSNQRYQIMRGFNAARELKDD